jgi:putative colanic acid biosynthesis UDP-glucose lipid carrier transferase
MNAVQNKGYIKRHSQLIVFFTKVFDSSVIFLTLMLATWLYSATSWNSKFAFLGLTAVVLFTLISEIAGLYQSWRGAPLHQEFFRVCLVWTGVVLTMLLIGYGLKVSSEFSRVAIGSWILATPMFLGLARIAIRVLLRHLRSRGYNTRSVAIVGAGEVGVKVFNSIKRSSWLGLRFVGFYDDRSHEAGRMEWDGKPEGDFQQLVERAKSGDIDLIYITLPLTAQPRIMELVDKLADTTVSVYLVPDFFVFNLFHGTWSNLDGISMVSVFETPFLGVSGWVKRLQDIVLSTVILAVTAIPMILISLAVRFTSPGPALFKQRRYGMDGNEIYVWKFRSMRVQEDGAKVVQATKDDSRITPIGAFLRRTSLDELPQFINVLMGEMSIVGPRPHAVAHNEEYRSLIKGYMLRHAVKPGITGWAQINGWRGETDTLGKMEKRVEHDLWYIQNWSFLLDLKIVLLTVFKGFVGKNAY